jgi:hypothetical protein
VGDLPGFQRGHIVGVHLAGASVTKTATLLGITQSSSFQGYDGIHKSWEDIIGLEE